MTPPCFLAVAACRLCAVRAKTALQQRLLLLGHQRLVCVITRREQRWCGRGGRTSGVGALSMEPLIQSEVHCVIGSQLRWLPPCSSSSRMRVAISRAVLVGLTLHKAS